MEPRPYQPSDFVEIHSWGKEWGSEYKADLFPPTGLIIPGLAAYFMYETQSKVVFLEHLVCNKEADKTLVKQALDIIVPALFKIAKEKGYEVAYASTNNPMVIERAIRVNASVKPNYALMQKDLTKLS